MGVLCDFIIADAAEAAEINASYCSAPGPQRWPALESKGVDPFKLATLWAILSGKEEDPFYMAGPEWEIDIADGSSVFRVPPDLVASVASLDAEAAKATATRWSEEFRHDRWSAEDVLEYFERFRLFARDAQMKEKDLLLWMCL